jgi:hypothetical protein
MKPLEDQIRPTHIKGEAPTKGRYTSKSETISTATADIYSSALTSCIWLQYYKIKNTKAV